MFRDDESTKDLIIERFNTLKKQLDALGEVTLTSEYHREMQKYAVYLAQTLISTTDLDKIR